MREAENDSLLFFSMFGYSVCHCCKKSLHNFDVDNPDRKRSRPDRKFVDAKEEYIETNEYCKNDNYILREGFTVRPCLSYLFAFARFFHCL